MPTSTQDRNKFNLGTLSAKLTEGFVKSLMKLNLTPPTSAQTAEATYPAWEARCFSASKAILLNFFGAMWASHPTIGYDNDTFCRVDAHIDLRSERKFHDSIIKSAEIIQASPCCKGRCRP